MDRTGAAPSATSGQTSSTPSSSTRDAPSSAARRYSSPEKRAVAGRKRLADDELLGAQLDRLTRRIDQAGAEKRRLADLYQAGLIELAELSGRAKEVAARRARLEAERSELTAHHHDLRDQNRLRQRLDDFAARATDGLDRLDVDGRQRLLRLVVEQVRVTGWQVEIRLRIPLPDMPRDGGSSPDAVTRPSGPRRLRGSR